MNNITMDLINKFKSYLINEEKSKNTLEKYIRDVTKLMIWLNNKPVCKSEIIEYKKLLMNKYMPRSVNSHISSINSFFDFLGWHEFKIKIIKIQKQVFSDSSKELTKNEYERLLSAAQNKNNEKLYLIMQTICSTGIRISELEFIKVESLKTKTVIINCKGKIRTILLPKRLCKILKEYSKKNKIISGPIFITRNGKPLNRSSIWRSMKKLCDSAGVDSKKVFPHNLRHLFARTFYNIQKDIVRLSNILGHSSIETTRIYIIEPIETHRKLIEKMHLLRC